MNNKLTKILLLPLMLLVVIGCGDLLELDENLDNPNGVNPETADINLVLNNVMIEFGQFADEVSDETMPYVRMTAMSTGNRYDNQDNPAAFDFMWNQAYAEVIPDCDLVIALAAAKGLNVHSGVAKTVKAYTLMTLVDLFGDVPLSEAFDAANFNPVADPGANVYAAALAMLDDAIADLNAGGANLSLDLYYDGTAAPWIKLANTLKLRYHVNTKLVGGSATEINSLIAGGDLISSASDSWAFNYGTTRANPDSRHPYYSDGYEDGGPGLWMSNYYMWLMFGEKTTEDPRLRYYFYRQDCDETDEDAFTLDCPTQPFPSHWSDGLPFCTASGEFGDPNDLYGGYWGRDHGNDDGVPPDDLKRTAWGAYPAGGKFDNNDCSQVSNLGTDGQGGGGIQPILMDSYVYFLRAEAALTMGTTDDAAAMLQQGVEASISYVTGYADGGDLAPSADQINSYVDEVMGNYNAAGSDDERLDVIMKENLLALHGMGLEAYNGYRRTCLPSGMQPTREQDPGPFARSFWYPAGSVNSNGSISQKDGVANPVFWDTNPAGCAN